MEVIAISVSNIGVTIVVVITVHRMRRDCWRKSGFCEPSKEVATGENMVCIGWNLTTFMYMMSGIRHQILVVPKLSKGAPSAALQSQDRS